MSCRVWVDPFASGHLLIAAQSEGGTATGPSRLLESRDGGDSWADVTGGLPEVNLDGYRVAFSPVTPGMVLAAADKTAGLYMSDTEGATAWHNIGTRLPADIAHADGLAVAPTTGGLPSAHRPGSVHLVSLATPAIPGDLDGDGQVTGDDLNLLATSYGLHAGAANWPAGYDLVPNDVIDLLDFWFVAHRVR